MKSSDNAPDDARLEAMLRRAAPALRDDGFSARVVSVLPPARRASRSRLWLCAVGALAGIAIAWMGGASWTALQTGFSQLGNHVAELAPLATDSRIVAALLVTALSLAFAFWRAEPESATR